MLKLVHIKKDYVMKDQESVHALKDININFRQNEFVAILGPSGCGKTTLLNITGGLDRYTSGDLVIRGKSTKDFKDRDWDTYRNHSIGFVFQSYNLISHLTILANVELGLTIGGYKRAERKAMAMKALDRVGLEGLYKKKPNQLSGGQMQRVAIARALVTNPEIVMADEPTGALDSETSIQIMDLLKEVAKDRLVIMVTHNPDLAEKYADRIIRMKDGLIESDSNPFEGLKYNLNTEEEIVDEKPNKRAKMKLHTAFSLSANNLWSKIKRTSLVVVAGSIGIIGVSAVLAVSHGVNTYIESMQDDMLSGNPITIQKSSIDMMGLLSAFSKSSQANAAKHAFQDGKVNVDYMIKYLAEQKDNLENFAMNNAIDENYVEFVKEMPRDYYSALKLEYGINPKINMYTEVKMTKKGDPYDAGDPDGPHKVDPAGVDRFVTLQSIEDMYTEIVKNTSFGEYASIISLFTTTFFSSPDNPEYILSQYDIISNKSTSHIATGEDEMMLVVSDDREATDIFLGQLGYYTEDEFITLINRSADKSEDNPYKDEDPGPEQFDYDSLLNKEFYYVPYKDNTTILPINGMNNPEYIYDTTLALNPDNPQCLDLPFSNYQYEVNSFSDLPANAKKMKITAILQPKKNVSYGCLEQGFVLSPAFEQKFLADSENSPVINKLLERQAWFNDLGVDDGVKDAARIEKENAMKACYTLTTPYSYSCGYSHTVETSGGKRIEYQDINGRGTVFAVADVMNSLGGGSWSSVLTKLFGSQYSIDTLYENAVRSVGGISNIPSIISIYPHSFDEKYLVTDYLDLWNDEHHDITLWEGTHDQVFLAGGTRDEINYNDNLELIISLIKTMINIITIALLAFTSLSLVVSTVMIGIITYVSVIERIKEIGVIRSLGGRKLDVSNLFNAETFIIGLSSGVFGITVTYILSLIINAIIHHFAGIGGLVFLPVLYAIIVIGVSIGLTLISGLIPARAAAHKDPVVALRTE